MVGMVVQAELEALAWELGLVVQGSGLELEALVWGLEQDYQDNHHPNCMSWNDPCCTELPDHRSLHMNQNHPICSSNKLAWHWQLPGWQGATQHESSYCEQLVVVC